MLGRAVKATAVLLFAASASACVSTDAPAPADDPFPANYKALISAHKSDIFIDPDSVKDVSISAPKRASGPTAPSVDEAPNLSKWETPWIVCVRANAKNRMGGYTGKQLTAVLIVRGQLFGIRSGLGQHGVDLGNHWCQDHQTYEPFPEIEASAKRS